MITRRNGRPATAVKLGEWANGRRVWFFLGVWLGIMLGAWVTYVGSNMKWQTEAWDHHAAVWRETMHDGKVRWQWLDDFYAEKGLAAPTPNKQITSGKWERL